MDPLQMQAMLAANMGSVAPGAVPFGAEAMLAANMGTVPGAMSFGTEASGTLSGLAAPQLDPSMQMYMTQMMQLFQQNLAQQSFAAATAGALPGMPPAPFAGAGSPYTPSLSTDPAISVSVEGMKFQYQLTEDDLMKVFSRYGAVKSIRVDEAGASATITYNAVQDAQAAMTDLNNKVLNGLDGTLRISWLSQPPAPAPFPAIPYPAMPFPGWGGFPPVVPTGTLGVPGGTIPGMPGLVTPGTSGAAATTAVVAGDDSKDGVRKYTCRFLIGIENDKDFQVARRIIGAKGANMKRIVKQTEAKLRLRGVGSGYFEGAGHKESAEPLQLCVSCTSLDGYKIAVSHVEELLKRVYDEYRQYCRDNSLPVPHLDINLSENQLVYSKLPATGSSGAGADVSPKRGEGRRSSGGRKSRSSKRETRAADGEVDRGEPGPNAPSIDEIERFIDERNEARRANNFTEADRIRELLHKRGVALMDEPGGRGRGSEVTTWRYWRD